MRLYFETECIIVYLQRATRNLIYKREDILQNTEFPVDTHLIKRCGRWW